MACLLMLTLAGCNKLSHTYRFKLTVNVQTAHGVRSGSSVYQVTAGNIPSLLPNERKRDWSVKGQAVAIDLPDHRTLFALLRTDNPNRDDLARMSMATLDSSFHNDVVESAGRLASGSGVAERAEVKRADYPLLITFGDPAVPGSARQPAEKIAKITAELTHEPVSRGIERRLPWLKTHHGALLHLPISAYPPPGTALPLAARLTEEDFKHE